MEVSWFVDNNIITGKNKLNLSHWAFMDYRDKRKAMSLMATNIIDNKMPTATYIKMHKDAKFNVKEKEAVLKWLFTIEILNE